MDFLTFLYFYRAMLCRARLCQFVVSLSVCLWRSGTV